MISSHQREETEHDSVGGGRVLARRAATVAGGTVVGQLLVALASPVLSRWFSPASFGLLGAFLGLSTVLGTCAAGRLELAVQSAETDTEAHDVALLAVRAALATALVALPVVAIAWVADHTAELGAALFLVPPTALAIALYNIGSFASIRDAQFRVVAKARVVLGAATIAPQLLAGAFGAGFVGLLIGPLAGWGAAALLLAGAVRHGKPTTMSVPWRTVLHKFRRFPLLSLWSSLFNRGALELPAILLIALFDARSAGLFYLCNRVLVVPANVVADGVYQSFLNEAGPLARTNPAELLKRTITLVRSLALLVVVPIAAAVVIVPALLPVIFGEAWEDAGQLAIRLLPMIGALIVSVPVSSQLWLFGRQDLELAKDFLRFVCVFGVFVVASWRSWSLEATVAGYSAVMAATYLTTLALVVLVARSRAHSADPIFETDGERYD